MTWALWVWYWLKHQTCRLLRIERHVEVAVSGVELAFWPEGLEASGSANAVVVGVEASF
jgi:hypothetical protein